MSQTAYAISALVLVVAWVIATKIGKDNDAQVLIIFFSIVGVIAFFFGFSVAVEYFIHV